MTAKLFIGNLPYSCTEDDLRSIFESAGTEPVDVRVIIDRSTGLSKGFGFVEMADYDAAIYAKGALSGAVLGDRNLVVDLAKPSASGKVSR
ncbi:MAG TPA: RNA-binding protein [Deltaproteobacteria bacterium]|nr:RNA-binding protein [Deltaproteobacteria bacterium]HCP48047.1 RNA-binding protein [Deltaproteobacteria bacterium]